MILRVRRHEVAFGRGRPDRHVVGFSYDRLVGGHYFRLSLGGRIKALYLGWWGPK